ncbi:MAG: T9SS type A sorting domain-containing protein [Bacteroidetes bacterium]|nr:T9SS type A sorting domain-containing protein [Bacteroidota bacterium]
MKKPILLIFLYFLSFINSEAQWYIQYQSTGVIYDIRFIDKNTGWACGGGMILKSTNGGTKWYSQNFYATFNQTHPVNDSVIYACGYYVIYKSVNGGENWIALREGTDQAPILYGLWFINETTGWFCGDRVAMRTTDGGQTFIDSMFIDSQLNDVHFKNYSTGNIAAWGRTYHTTNSGANWNPVTLPSPLATPFTEKITFVGDTGWTVTRGRLVYRTTNYGIIWDSLARIPIEISETMISIEFADNMTGYAGGYVGKIFKTTNGGFNWFLSAQHGAGPYGSIYAYNRSIVWAVGGPGGGYIVNTLNGGLTNLSQIENLSIRKFELNQNYPNPFNPSTNIQYDLPSDNFVTIKVYNSLGKEVMSHINEYKTAGRYIVSFSGADLSNGVYYYKIKAGGFEQVRKMVLLK